MERKILKAEEESKNDIVNFLRDMIRIPSPRCREEEVVDRIK